LDGLSGPAPISVSNSMLDSVLPRVNNVSGFHLNIERLVKNTIWIGFATLRRERHKLTGEIFETRGNG